jgi:hypothetical protein
MLRPSELDTNWLLDYLEGLTGITTTSTNLVSSSDPRHGYRSIGPDSYAFKLYCWAVQQGYSVELLHSGELEGYYWKAFLPKSAKILFSEGYHYSPIRPLMEIIYQCLTYKEAEDV